MTWTLHQGDCLDPVSGLASLADDAVDCAISDPPYSEHTHTRQRRGTIGEDLGRRQFCRTTDLGFDHLSADVMAAAAMQFGRLVRRWCLVFCDERQIEPWREALSAAGLDVVRVGAWVKLGATPQFTGDRPASGWEAIIIAHRPGRKQWNGGGRHNVWTCPIVQNHGTAGEKRCHTTQKPLALMEALVRDFTDPDELILDPFAGSGTTGVAALRHGRRFIGWEQQEKYADVARRRLDEVREQRAFTFEAEI